MSTVRHLQEGDRARVAHLQKQAFILPPERVAIAGNYALHEGWVVEADGIVQGALRIQKLGQFFGGKPVPCAAVSSVKVAAEARGGGLGGQLLEGVLANLRAEGVAIATLFPVHTGVYRRYGWEVAFACQRRTLPLSELTVRNTPGRDALSVVPFDKSELGDVADFYREQAVGENGLFDRGPDWWAERVLAPRYEREPYQYVARAGREIRGYLLYTHEPAGSHLPYTFNLECRDFFWRDPAAAAAMLRFVQGHLGMGQNFSWIAAPADPLELVLEGTSTITSRQIAMCRIVDVDAALTSRGYPEGVEGSVTFRVEDDVLPGNAGTITLTVADGRGTVSRGESAAPVKVDIRGLASLFTGSLDPAVAADKGILQGANAAVIRDLRAMFAGAAPWMGEYF